MANFNKRVPENVPGEFFVDSTCIDCDTCRQLAPATFGETAAYAFVHTQPQTIEATRRRYAPCWPAPPAPSAPYITTIPMRCARTFPSASTTRYFTAASIRPSHTVATVISCSMPTATG